MEDEGHFYSAPTVQNDGQVRGTWVVANDRLGLIATASERGDSRPWSRDWCFQPDPRLTSHFGKTGGVGDLPDCSHFGQAGEIGESTASKLPSYYPSGFTRLAYYAGMKIPNIQSSRCYMDQSLNGLTCSAYYGPTTKLGK